MADNASSSTTLVSIIVVVSILAITVLVTTITRKRRDIVYYNSRIIPLVNQLNELYTFYPIRSDYCVTKTCSSKREYDRFAPTDYLCSMIMSEPQLYYNLISQTRENQRNYSLYLKHYNKFLNEETDAERMLYSKWHFFKTVETKICKSIMLKPVTEPTITIVETYCSPKGQNSYRNSSVFNISQIEACYNEAQRIIQRRNTSKYQREIMTDSLRYDIMKRDGFRCVLCGASVAEGVKLHVDHILPVSRGGKTEPNNLRTLCDRCNLGKSAKYDPYGPN